MATIKAFDTGIVFTDNLLLNGTPFDTTGCTNPLFLMRAAVGGKVFSDVAVLAAVQSSGLLTIGTMYRILVFQAGDDFTNVGAASNASGVVFVATGTTPNVWTHATTITQGGISYSPGTGFPSAVGNYNQEWQLTTTASKQLTFPGDSYNPIRILETLNDL